MRSNLTRELGLCALLLPAMALLNAETGPCPKDPPQRRIVLTIGINHYLHSAKWPLLRSAVDDADSLEQLLEAKYGYQSYESLARLSNDHRLRDGVATRDTINGLVQDELPKVLCGNDDFILFFSGHGDSRPYQNGAIKGATGYLIPFDGREEGVSSLIEVKEFLENVGHLPARHILVILDACHSGVAIQDALQGMKASADYQAALAARFSRKVIVSAQPDQTASDAGTIPKHSLFGGLLYQALDQGLAAKGRDFIADSQLADFVKEEVASANPNQLPDSAPFLGNEGGSLVLKLDQDLGSLYRNAMNNLLEDRPDDFRANVNTAIQRSPDDLLTLSLQYRLALLRCDVDQASASIDKLRDRVAATQANPDSLPIPRSAMLEIRHQLSFWKNAIRVPIPAEEPAVTIHAYTGATEQNLSQLSGSNEFSLAPEANLYFKLRARKQPVYVYVFRIDKEGRIESIPDFVRLRENPVDIDQETLSSYQDAPEADDLHEYHFIFSSRQIDVFTSPPAEGDLAGATQYVVTVRPQ